MLERFAEKGVGHPGTVSILSEAMVYLEWDKIDTATGNLWGCWLDGPQQVAADVPPYLLPLRGWVLPRCGSAVAVEVVHDGHVVRRTPVNGVRDDLLEAFPDIQYAHTAGFSTVIPLRVAAAPVELLLRVVLASQLRIDIGTIRLVNPQFSDGIEHPLVTIAIPCYRQSQFLADAIESALAQTHPCVEVIVVDDGSPDNTGAVAKRYPGVGYVRQDNSGLAGARNTALRVSTGQYIVFLDADDKLLPHAVSTGIDELQQAPAAAFAAGVARFIDEDGTLCTVSDAYPSSKNYYAELLRNCFITCPAVAIFRRSLLEEVGGFDTSNNASADYDVYLRLARTHGLRYHRSSVADYRRHGSNMTRAPGLMLRAERSAIDAQLAYVRKTPSLAASYKAGVEHGRAYYGSALVAQLLGHIAAREWRATARDSIDLARYYPAGLLQLGRALVMRASGPSRVS